ncbi:MULTISPECIES: AAA family ATPase [unclassified Streptomyces]|uniref:AAA family ATPase n=1 Tax=unclassified Streptomyces TaxID=2593676 RepID=UPI00202514A8|nr:AAA family ATPase [Streptomyces sp. A 4/2]WSV58416.1 ATP-binding protein [Streptomyces sp. NBC_01014]
MPVPTVVIVSGPPGAGKTYLARRLAARLALPWYSRDTIKEALFDTLGWSDRSRSKELGSASVAVLFSLLSDTLGSGTSCLAESNFRRTLSSPDFQRLLSTTGAGAVQIQCSTDGETLLARFAARSFSVERHPGHCDDQNIDEFREELLAGRYEPLDLPGPILTVDTTHFDHVDIDALAAQVSALLHPDAR